MNQNHSLSKATCDSSLLRVVQSIKRLSTQIALLRKGRCIAILYLFHLLTIASVSDSDIILY